MIRLMIVTTLCIVPLCATDEFKKPFYRGDLGHIVCELVMLHGIVRTAVLKDMLLVCKHMEIETSTKLDEYRAFLKKSLRGHHASKHSTVIYSLDGLEAVVAEKATTQRPNKKNPGYALPFNDRFLYRFIAERDRVCGGEFFYERLEHTTTYKPFFTPSHACVDFGLDITRPWVGLEVPTGLSLYRRVTGDFQRTRFFIKGDTTDIPTGWLARTVPDLHKEIMEASNKFVYAGKMYFRQSKQKSKQNAYLSVPGFSLDLAKVKILTPEEISLISTFVYNSFKDLAEKEKKVFLSLLFCYGKLDDICHQLDDFLGGSEISCFLGSIEFLVSNLSGKVSWDDDFATSKGTCEHVIFGDSFVKNTKGYIKKTRAEVREKMNHDQPFAKAINIWQAPIKFLKKKRMILRCQKEKAEPKGYYLIRYDSLSSDVAVFYKGLFSHVRPTLYQKVSPAIDLDSIKIFDLGEHIQYKLKKE